MRGMRGEVLCLARKEGRECKRRPLEVVYIDRTGQAWGLCERAGCARAYSGDEVDTRAEVKSSVRADESKPERAVNPFTNNPFTKYLKKGTV